MNDQQPDTPSPDAVQAHLAAIVASSDDGIVSKTLDGIVESWNGSAERIFGYSAEEMIGQSITKIIPPERQDEEPQILARLRRGERVDHFKTVRMRKDGRRIAVSVTISPVKDRTGRVVGASKVVRDLTATTELARRFEAIVESSDDAIISKDLNGIVQSWNPAAERIFGYTAAEMIGRPLATIFPPDRLKEEDEILARLRRGERIDHFETVRLRKDGTPLDISVTVSPIRGAGGEIIGASKIARDITETRRSQQALAESEARLRAVVEATPECVKIVASDGTLRYMNTAGLQFIEADGGVPTGARVLDLIAPEDRETWRVHHERVCAGEKLTWEFQIIGLRGARRWMETHAVPLPLPDGSTGQLAVTRDITQRKAAEREREVLLESERAARVEAERASRMKDEFLATLSHELRTPLNAILGWSSMLAGGVIDASQSKQAIDVIARNARSQAQIIEDLLDMSRIISGKIRLDVQRIDLPSVLKTAIESVRPAADAKGVKLTSVLDPTPGVVSGDANRLQQIFWNLLTNAVKFTPKGGRVQVLLERVNSHVEASVIDSGEGISPEFLPQVFDRFRQADASTTRKHGGLGLGLSIVKNLVELHGGSISVRSAGKNQGSTFTVSLPLTVVHPEPEHAGERRHPRVGDGGSSGGVDLDLSGIKVLVVDDEPDARMLVQRLLEDRGATVVTAGSAEDGVARARDDRPNILISDVGMPGEDGYSLLKRVRALGAGHGGDVPAVALTAYARAEDRVRSVLAGFQMHIAKPVEPAELIATVASLAGRTRG